MSIPKEYVCPLDTRQTEIAIKKVKDFFERDLAIGLNLTRVSAPLFVSRESGLNDNLNGVERPVDFDIRGQEGRYEVVQSLAKWKRMALARYGFKPGEGLYTDMNAIRRDEDIDAVHSVLVDQWDWEKIITPEQRCEKTLKAAAKCVYNTLKHTENYISDEYSFVGKFLPEKLTFITTQELEDLYPDLPPKRREYEFVKAHGAVFLMQIGGALRSGVIHDGRAPDYDDWDLNGDLLVYYPVLDISFELSSMGIRVDSKSLLRQLKIRGALDRAELDFHKKLLSGELPLTMGGGIGQSRMCMFFLRKSHIGEVQASVWPESVRSECEQKGIFLL